MAKMFLGDNIEGMIRGYLDKEGETIFDELISKFKDSALDNLSYKLIDINGKAIANGSITNTDTQINMQSLALGMYILKVNQNNQELKTFKIIKK